MLLGAIRSYSAAPTKACILSQLKSDFLQLARENNWVCHEQPQRSAQYDCWKLSAGLVTFRMCKYILFLSLRGIALTTCGSTAEEHVHCQMLETMAAF